MDIDKLYEKYNILSDAKDKIAEHVQDYVEAMEGTKGGDKEKKLSTQIISKFFKHFPSQQTKALHAILDLCEDDDTTIRICAIKVLPTLCKDSKEHLPKVVYILSQLLQLEDQEYNVATTSLQMIYNDNPQEVIKSMFQCVKVTTEFPARERCITFALNTLVKRSTGNPELEDITVEECKKILAEGNPEDFISIMPYLTSSKIAKTVTGAQQLLELIADQIDMEEEFNPNEENTNNTDKVVTCLKFAVQLFSAKLESTKFVIYICDQILPHWDAIGKLEKGEMAQYQILKNLAEMSTYCGKLENPSLHVVHIFDKLKTYMPVAPEDPENAEVPNLDFSSVECLLYAFHRLARQCPDLITHDPEVLKDFRSRLLYFSRGVQGCRKALALQKKGNITIKNEDQEKYALAPSMLDNINSLIKDLFYQPPIYKCSVVLSFKLQEGRKIIREKVSLTTSITEEKAPVAGKRHIPITFDSNGSTPSKQTKPVRGGESIKLYQPPSGKYSNNSNFNNYERSTFRGRGRGGFRGSRGRGGRGNWRN